MGHIDVTLGQGLGLSELAPGVVQSEIRAMTQECDRMGGVNLAQGVCDTEAPEVVAEGAGDGDQYAVESGGEGVYAGGTGGAGGDCRRVRSVRVYGRDL